MRRPGESEQKRDAGGIPPLRVFLGLVALLVVVGAVVLLTRDEADPPPIPRASGSPDFSLTDEEAIARFKELRELRDQMYRGRDQSLIPLIYTDDSPAKLVVLKELRRLTRDQVFDRSRYRTRAIEVKSNETHRIQLTERITLFPRFIDEDGKNVTRDVRPLFQTATWVLVDVDGIWLVQESVLEKSERKSG